VAVQTCLSGPIVIIIIVVIIIINISTKPEACKLTKGVSVCIDGLIVQKSAISCLNMRSHFYFAEPIVFILLLVLLIVLLLILLVLVLLLLSSSSLSRSLLFF